MPSECEGLREVPARYETVRLPPPETERRGSPAILRDWRRQLGPSPPMASPGAGPPILALHNGGGNVEANSPRADTPMLRPHSSPDPPVRLEAQRGERVLGGCCVVYCVWRPRQGSSGHTSCMRARSRGAGACERVGGPRPPSRPSCNPARVGGCYWHSATSTGRECVSMALARALGGLQTPHRHRATRPAGGRQTASVGHRPAPLRIDDHTMASYSGAAFQTPEPRAVVSFSYL